MRVLPLSVIAAAAFVCASSAQAQSTRCRVMDPTGTPLNLRVQPGGAVVGQLPNGMLVTRAETVRVNGRQWTFVHSAASGDPLGWVFREFISCF